MEKEKKWSVYIHTNKINNKKYIGMTCDTDKRFGKNGSGYLRKHNGEFNQPLFARAILKYGWNNFNTEIIFVNLSKEEADLKEKELIKYYDSQNPKCGYNIKDGGSNGSLSDETKEKISKKMLNKYDKEKNPFFGKHHTEEAKKKIGEKNKKNRKDISGPNNPMYHKKHTEEARKKISDSVKGRILSEKTKQKISQSNKEFYEHHQHHKKGTHLSEETKQKLREKMLNRKMSQEWKDKIGQKHAIYFYKCLETGEIFNSSVEASKKMNIHKSSIQNVTNGKQKTTGGYHWEKILKE